MTTARNTLLALAALLAAAPALAADGGPGQEIVCHMTDIASGKPKGATLDPVYGTPSGEVETCARVGVDDGRLR